MPIIDPMLSLRRGPWLSVVLVLLSVIAACKGDTGEQGPEGPPGEPGEPGQPPDGSIDPAPLGLVGRVMEPNMVPVPSGTVYLVPAERSRGALGHTDRSLRLAGGHRRA